ncbi:MAG: cation diffusion facilitator family transporter [Symbiobacterium sp.]|uniref:cation diffusion facilitator family transporter n=1 Tax=Symbiobacterium sp. TaxID=1971213 RepID=UPI0034642E12
MAETGRKGAWLSIGVYCLLTAAKLTVGWLAGSQAIAADGVNNATDVLGSVAVLLGLIIAQRPADEEHRYGHARAEGVASLVVATIMGLASLEVARSAFLSLLSTDRAAPEGWSLWVAVGSAAVLLAIYAYNLRLARRCGSSALESAAYDHLSDALISLGTAAGVAGSGLGWYWADPVAGLAVAALVARTAWSVGREAAHMLMDGGPDQERIAALEGVVSGVEGVCGVQDLRARLLGNRVAVDVTVLVPQHMSVVEAHAVADRVEHALTRLAGVHTVQVHVEPDVKAG